MTQELPPCPPQVEQPEPDQPGQPVHYRCQARGLVAGTPGAEQVILRSPHTFDLLPDAARPMPSGSMERRCRPAERLGRTSPPARC